MVLTTTGQIATNIAKSFVLPMGVSGCLIQTVDNARIDVQNFTGKSIDENSIDEKYLSVITNLAKAQAIDEAFVWSATVATSGGAVIISSGTSDYNDVKLDDLTIKSTADAETKALSYLTSLSKDTPNLFRQQANLMMKNLGRAVNFRRSIS